MLPSEWLMVGITLIQFVSTLIIMGYVVVAASSLLRQPNRRGMQRARRQIAEGALFGLSLVVAATLLKTIVVQSFPQLGIFAAVFALRTVLKRVFTWEARQM